MELSPSSTFNRCVQEERHPPLPHMRKTKSAPKKRSTSNKKERRRNWEINNAFQKLQETIPHLPDDAKIPKVKTLRLAMNYIQHLTGILMTETNNSETHRYQTSPSPYYAAATMVQPAMPSMIQHAQPMIRINDFAQIVDSELQTRNTYSERAAAFLATSQIQGQVQRSSSSTVTGHSSLMSECRQQLSPTYIANYHFWPQYAYEQPLLPFDAYANQQTFI